MPRRSVLSAPDRTALLALPDKDAERIRLYTFSETDLALIRQRRGDANRLGFAVQLCLLRYPGAALASGQVVDDALVRWIASTLWLDSTTWSEYAMRDTTRRQLRQQLFAYLELSAFGLSTFRALVGELVEVALRSDKGLVLASHALASLRRRRIVVPPLRVIDRVCSQAIHRANRQLYRRLTRALDDGHRARLDALLDIRPGGAITRLSWLRQSPMTPSSRGMLQHIERLHCYQTLGLPAGLGRDVHRTRLVKIAGGGRAQMRPWDLGELEVERRHATLAALAIEGRARVTDEIIELHDRIMIKLVATARNKHLQRFQSEGRAINDKVRLYVAVGQALVAAREASDDAFAAIERVLPWGDFVESVGAAEALARPGSFDHLSLVADQFATLRRYTPAFLAALRFNAAPVARPILAAIETLREMNAAGSQRVPPEAPIAFVRTRWKPLVFTERGIERRYYEICALSELKNALRAGDIWVEGSRRYGNFDHYLIPTTTFAALSRANALSLAIHAATDLVRARIAHAGGRPHDGELGTPYRGELAGRRVGVALEPIALERRHRRSGARTDGAREGRRCRSRARAVTRLHRSRPDGRVLYTDPHTTRTTAWTWRQRSRTPLARAA